MLQRKMRESVRVAVVMCRLEFDVVSVSGQLNSLALEPGGCIWGTSLLRSQNCGQWLMVGQYRPYKY